VGLYIRSGGANGHEHLSALARAVLGSRHRLHDRGRVQTVALSEFSLSRDMAWALGEIRDLSPNDAFIQAGAFWRVRERALWGHDCVRQRDAREWKERPVSEPVRVAGLHNPLPKSE
jgi:hypothetical protein